MNTPAHLLIGGTFGRRSSRLIAYGMLGGALPDLSLYLLAGVSLFVLQIPPQVVFDELYFSDLWQTIFAIDNSVLVWGTLLALAWRTGRQGGTVLCLGALAHVALDLPLHAGDGRAHFWPLTDWVFDSPLSYWDRTHYAWWIAPLEALCAFAAAVWLWMQRGWVRWAAAMLLLAELWVVYQWLFVFAQ